MRFSKWHALGNAYLVVERGEEELSPQQVSRLCDVGVGVGSDGLLEVVTSTETNAEIVIWNPDGSMAEMSGNGTRIAAAWVAARSGATEITISTAVERVVTAQVHDGGLIEQRIGGVSVGALETIDVDGDAVELVAVDVGNPHAVLPTAGASRETLLRLGPLVERHPRFPQRTNVQLVQADSRHEVRAFVWERGAGETSSSGSSAVAVAAAAVALGWCDSPVAVHFPGGDLSVVLDEGSATLVGPAVQICRGEVLCRPV